MRLAPREETDFSSSEYRHQVLQLCDRLPGTGQRSTLENVLETLRTFRQEWHRHQPYLVPFDVCQLTGLCPDVVIEITKYLSLDETINAFSMSILSLLRDGYSKVHLNNPAKRFVEMIPQHLDPRQVTSLRIADDPRRLRSDLTAFHTFDQLISLTILSERASHRIEQCLNCLPNIRRLSLWLDDASNCFDYYWAESQQPSMRKNFTITSFTFDLEYYAIGRTAQFRSLNSPHFLTLSRPAYFEEQLNVKIIRLFENNLF